MSHSRYTISASPSGVRITTTSSELTWTEANALALDLCDALTGRRPTVILEPPFDESPEDEPVPATPRKREQVKAELAILTGRILGCEDWLTLAAQGCAVPNDIVEERIHLRDLRRQRERLVAELESLSAEVAA